jgi:hypothetical protein
MTSTKSLVQERKAGNEVVTSVQAANELLRVVAKKLKDGDHGKASVVELLGLLDLELLSRLVLGLSVSEDQKP